MLKALKGVRRDERIYIKGVTDALVLTYLNFANSNVCQEQSNGNASWGVLYITLIDPWLNMLGIFVGILYIYISVGLSALLVSNNPGNAKALIAWNGQQVGSTFL